MNYNFFLAKDDTFIVTEFMDEAFRPRLFQELVLNNVSRKIWKVVRLTPTGNPTGNANNYFLEEVD